jgi:predicted Ser/Thr protein kinase
MRFADLGHRQHLVDDGAEAAGGEEGEDVADERLHQRGAFFEAAAAHDGAADGDALAEEQGEVEVGADAAEQADHHDGAERGDGAEVFFEVAGADEVEDDFGAAGGEREDGVGEARGVDDDAVIEAEGAAALELVGRARGADGGGAGGANELHGGGADAAGDGVDEDRLAEPQVALRDQRVVGGEKGLGDGGGFFEREIGGDRDGLALVEENVCGHGAAADDGHDAIAGRERGDAGADGGHGAGELEAGDVGGDACRRGVEAHALEDIGAVQAGGGHLDEDLGPGGRPRVDLAEIEHCFVAGLADAHRSCHGPDGSWRRDRHHGVLGRMGAEASVATGTCLDADTVAGLLDGVLDGEQRRRAEAHLDACGECRDLVAELAAAARGDTREEATLENARTRREVPVSSGAASWVTTLPKRASAGDALYSPGDDVDHFRVERILGQGGMGEVYLARDQKLGRKVALKVVNDSFVDTPRALERFLREARTTARLNHPHIVTIHAVGEHRGRPYLALEYVEGETLRRWMRDRGRGELREVLQMGLSIAEALAEAHRFGVLHKDLKPENVLVGKDGRVRVVDFGLAETVEVETVPPSVRHEVGPIVTGLAGTPRYMAPEQWLELGASGATDVWALGVMLHELVSGGEHPFTAAETNEIAIAVCNEGPRPLRDAPPAVRALVARCLARQPGDRPASREVAAALRGLIDAVEPRRSRLWQLLGAVAAVVVLTGVAVVVGRGDSAGGAALASAPTPHAEPAPASAPAPAMTSLPAASPAASASVAAEPTALASAAPHGADDPRGRRPAATFSAPPATTAAPPAPSEPTDLLKKW